MAKTILHLNIPEKTMEILKPYRARIDAIDDQIIDLLVKRSHVIHEVAALKKEKNIPAILPDRVEQVIERCAARAEMLGLDASLVRSLYTTIVGHSCDVEEKIIRKA